MRVTWDPGTILRVEGQRLHNITSGVSPQNINSDAVQRRRRQHLAQHTTTGVRFVHCVFTASELRC